MDSNRHDHRSNQFDCILHVPVNFDVAETLRLLESKSPKAFQLLVWGLIIPAVVIGATTMFDFLFSFLKKWF